MRFCRPCYQLLSADRHEWRPLADAANGPARKVARSLYRSAQLSLESDECWLTSQPSYTVSTDDYEL